MFAIKPWYNGWMVGIEDGNMVLPLTYEQAMCAMKALENNAWNHALAWQTIDIPSPNES